MRTIEIVIRVSMINSDSTDENYFESEGEACRMAIEKYSNNMTSDQWYDNNDCLITYSVNQRVL